MSLSPLGFIPKAYDFFTKYAEFQIFITLNAGSIRINRKNILLEL